MTDHKIIRTENVTSLELEPEPIQPPSRWWRITQITVGFIFIGAMLYLGGIYQYTRFQTTPTNTSIQELAPMIEAETQDITTTVFVLTADEEVDIERINQLTENTNRILAQAAVRLSPVKVETVPIAERAQPGPELVSSRAALREYLPPLADDRLHVVITETLGGINGVAFSGTDVVAVAEYTTGFDFRVLAHEVGHALTLDHVPDKSNLMNSGGSGADLTPTQARQAHDVAVDFSPTDS